MQARYGRVKTANNRLLYVVAVIVGVVGFAILLWVGLGLSKAQTHSRIISFNVVDPTLTTITFEVTKPTDRSAECVVAALNTGFSQVGVKTVQIGPADTDTVPLFVEISTSEVATTAIIDQCELLD